MPDIAGYVERTLQGLDAVLLAIRASGGYKFRQFLHGTDKEIEEQVVEAIPKLRYLVLSLIMAEDMLKEFCPRCGLERWAVYCERRENLLAALQKRLEANAKPKVKLERMEKVG